MYDGMTYGVDSSEAWVLMGGRRSVTELFQ